MPFDWHRQWWLGVAIFLAVAVLFGLMGRRWRTLKTAVVGLALISAAVPLLYFIVEGNVSQCSGSGATFRCVEVSYASTWNVADWILVGAVVLLTLAPVLSAVLHSRLPSVLAAIILAGLIAPNLSFLYSWILAGGLVVGAAIAGPPPREPRATSPPDLPT
jgi:hypothetical protein